jgi:hypothetical protein
MRARSRFWPGGLLLLVALGCGGASKSNGGAGAGAQGPRAGEPCVQGSCMQGLSCEHTGIFAGICTAGCGSDPACGLLNSHARCYGTPNPECGLPCGIDTDCPAGTHCVALGAVGTERVCRVPP